jgi:PAS domain S-box-containing protein
MPMAPKSGMAKTMRIDILPGVREEGGGAPASAWHLSGGKGAVRPRPQSPVRSEDYRQLLECVYDAAVVTDAAGRIVDLNSRACDFFRCGSDVLASANVVSLISGADQRLLDAIARNLQDHRYTLIEAYCVRYDETTFPAEIAVNRVDLPPSGRLCFFVRDVTLRKRAQEALEEAVARLEEHDRSRSMFVFNVSHELRTPLTSMIYAITNLLRGVLGPLTPDVRQYLEMLNGDCRRLFNTVSDILDLRKLEDQTLTLSRTVVPVGRLVMAAMDTLRMHAERKSLRMNVERPTTGWFVSADVLKLDRVFMNIIGNAIKFTPEGGAVTARVEADPDRPGSVVVRIVDTGIGIPPEAIDKVTQRYFTVGDQVSGSGLGLAISREIVELHSGALSVCSPPSGMDRGTMVSVSLAAAAAPNVLLVGQNDEQVGRLRAEFERSGYRVFVAGNAGESLVCMDEVAPVAVVIDLSEPSSDGTELILRMRSDKVRRSVPILALADVSLGAAKEQVLHSLSIPVMRRSCDGMELIGCVEDALLGPGSAVHIGAARSGAEQRAAIAAKEE